MTQTNIRQKPKEDNALNRISLYRLQLMGIATLWIMLFHAKNDFGLNLINRLATIGYGGVDIFFFLSGYSLYYLSRKKDFEYGYYKRRFTRIFPEFFFVLFIICIIKDLSLMDFFILISSIGFWLPFTGFPYLLWFIPSIVMLYIIFPLYIKNYDSAPVKFTLTGIIMGILLCLVYLLYFRFDSIHGIVRFFARIPIFFVGVYFGMNSYYHTIFPRKYIYITGGLFVVGLVTLFYFIQKYIYNDFIVLINCGLFYYPFILITPFLCVLLTYILQYVPQIMNDSIKFIGMLSFEIYLIHEFIFEYEPLLVRWMNCSSSIAYLLLMILSIIVAYMIYTLKEILPSWSNRGIIKKIKR